MQLKIISDQLMSEIEVKQLFKTLNDRSTFLAMRIDDEILDAWKDRGALERIFVRELKNKDRCLPGTHEYFAKLKTLLQPEDTGQPFWTYLSRSFEKLLNSDPVFYVKYTNNSLLREKDLDTELFSWKFLDINYKELLIDHSDFFEEHASSERDIRVKELMLVGNKAKLEANKKREAVLEKREKLARRILMNLAKKHVKRGYINSDVVTILQERMEDLSFSEAIGFEPQITFSEGQLYELVSDAYTSLGYTVKTEPTRHVSRQERILIYHRAKAIFTHEALIALAEHVNNSIPEEEITTLIVGRLKAIRESWFFKEKMGFTNVLTFTDRWLYFVTILTLKKNKPMLELQKQPRNWLEALYNRYFRRAIPSTSFEHLTFSDVPEEQKNTVAFPS